MYQKPRSITRETIAFLEIAESFSDDWWEKIAPPILGSAFIAYIQSVRPAAMLPEHWDMVSGIEGNPQYWTAWSVGARDAGLRLGFGVVRHVPAEPVVAK